MMKSQCIHINEINDPSTRVHCDAKQVMYVLRLGRVYNMTQWPASRCITHAGSLKVFKFTV